MLESILDEEIAHHEVAGETIFRRDIDYDDVLKRRGQLIGQWPELPADKKQEFNNDVNKFTASKGIPDLKDPQLMPAKNYALLQGEVRARLASSDTFQLLQIDDIEYENSVVELVENMENATQIRELYRLRKKNIGGSHNAGINSTEATRLRNCLRQGRELYISGKQGSLMVKPLNFFYSLTAYAYAIVILNNPIRYSLDNLPASHGVTYLRDEIKIQFGGDVKRGTFSDLVGSFPTTLLKSRDFEIVQDNCDSIYQYYKNRITVSTGLLLSLIPELNEYYRLITGRRSRAHPLDVVHANDPRSVKWEFQIGDGEHRPPPDDVERAFPSFPITERYGKAIVIVPAADSHRIRACIYTDVRGHFWYVENPFLPFDIA